MNGHRPPAHPWTAGAAALLIAVLAVIVTGDNWLTKADASAVSEIAAVRTPFVADLAHAVTWLGNVLVLAVITLTFGLSIRRLRPNASFPFLPLAALALTAAIDPVLKLAIGRPRPPAELAELVETASGFPSGHSAQSMAAWLAMGFVIALITGHRHRWLLAGAAVSILVGISRVILGVHSPTDLVGGWALGIVCVVVAHAGAVALARRRAVPDSREPMLRSG